MRAHAAVDPVRVELARCPASGGPAQSLRPTCSLSTWLPLIAGLCVRVDPLTPDTWLDVSTADENPATHEALTAVAADDRWRRIAALDALDHWLQAPLDQSLIDAEKAIARADLREDVAVGPLRTALLGQSVALARGAAFGLQAVFQRLARPAPAVIDDALRWLIDGNQRLAVSLAEPDDLLSVVRAGQRLLATTRRAVTDPDPRPPAYPSRRRRAGRRWISALDPRQLPARVVALGDDPSRGEVVTRLGRVNGITVLDVDVPAFGDLSDRDALDDVHERLLARFVDRATGQVRAQLLLTAEVQADATGKRHVFRTRLPLDNTDSLDPALIRVDVVDAAIERPPARTDTDADLLAVRQAMIRLRDQREQAAIAALGEASTGTGRPMIAELVRAHELSRASAS